MAARAKRHSQTRLLKWMPRVSTFFAGVHELQMTSWTDSGSLMLVHVISGTKSILATLPASPRREMVWSMPPHAVPAKRSALIVRSASCFYLILSSTPLACAVVIAEHTVKEELEPSPAAHGTLESIKILSPHGLATYALSSSSCARMAL